MTMQDRQLEILRAIVDEYVATEEPVGSKVIAEKHGLGVSPATIRNDMAVLEDAGLIKQPHTSAGRIPTNSGYRLFVDKIAEIKPLSTGERRAIEGFLDGAVDLDDVFTRTAKLLAQITKQVAVIQYPDEDKVVLAGTANLARSTQEVSIAIHPILEALEEHVVLLRLFGEAAEPDSLTVRIGHENPVEELQRASVVTVGYGSGDQALATMGILGPTRMDYAGSMGAVRAVAKYVGQILKDQ